MDADIISFFVASKGKKVEKIDEKSSNRRSKNLYLLKDLVNFNENFKKNITYDDIRSDSKKKAYNLFRQLYFFKIYS